MYADLHHYMIIFIIYKSKLQIIIIDNRRTMQCDYYTYFEINNNQINKDRTIRKLIEFNRL